MSAKLAALSATLVLAAGLAAAQDVGQSLISEDRIELDVLRRAIEQQPQREMLRMRLSDCVAAALEHNADIRVAAIEPFKSDADVLGAQGEFDPLLQASGVYNRSSRSADQQVLVFGGINSIESYNTALSAGVGGKLHTGTQYSLTFNLNKNENTFGGLIEEFDAFLNATISQPLLRGFGMKVNTVRIEMARNLRDMTQAQWELSILNTVGDVVRSYWDLVGAMENLKVLQSALDNAERLLDVNEKRRDLGYAADIEVVQAKAGVAMRQSDVIAGRAQILNANNLLLERLGRQTNPEYARVQIFPIDRPNPEDASLFDPATYEESESASVAKALERRPEMRMSDIEIANAELERLSARNAMMPQLDLSGSYGRGGRDHFLRETFQGARRGEDNAYSIGIIGSVPLGNRTARGAYERAKHELHQSGLRREQTRQQLALNVRLSAQSVVTNQFLIESNLQTERLQQANVAAEEKRLNLGASTPWQVLQIQEDLTAAQTQVVQAEVAYEQALVDLQVAEGTLLDNLGIEVEAPDTEAPIGYWRSIEPEWSQFRPRWK